MTNISFIYLFFTYLSYCLVLSFVLKSIDSSFLVWLFLLSFLVVKLVMFLFFHLHYILFSRSVSSYSLKNTSFCIFILFSLFLFLLLAYLFLRFSSVFMLLFFYLFFFFFSDKDTSLSSPLSSRRPEWHKAEAFHWLVCRSLFSAFSETLPQRLANHFLCLCLLW